jgi:adenylate cyclase
MERRLVTILAADAASYSRLVADDEDAALAFFQQCSAIMTEVFEAHQGRIFGGAGDSVVCEFSSPVEALRSAVEIQQQLEKTNEKLHEEKRMRFRLGLNLGDAVVVDGNLFGEAVNVAARLEGLAEPGGICISGSLYEQVKHLPDFSFHDLGARNLKNIPFQVHVYAVQGTGSRRAGKRLSSWWWPAAIAVLAFVAILIGWKNLSGLQSVTASAQPSIAVLPLENLSGDASQEYFSDGLTQDITTDLSKFSNLFVVASNSAFTFKGKPSKAQDIGYKLGVRYLLEGTVQKTPDRLRVNAQLIDVESGNHVWAQRYDRGLGDVFVVQEEILQNIVTALAVKVNSAELKRVGHIETRNMDAYDFYLQAKKVLNDPDKATVEGNDETRHLLEKSIELDANFSMAYGLLSYVYVREYQNAWSEDRNASLKKAEDYAHKELALADSFDGHWSIAIVYSNQGEFEKSLNEYEIARSLNPNDPDLLAEMGEALIYAGKIETALAQIKDAIIRNPYPPPMWYRWNLGRAQYMARQYQEAIDTIAMINDPPIDVLLITAASKAQLGQLDAAKADMAKFSASDPNWSIAKSAEYYYKNDGDRQHWLDGLRKAGLKEK